MFSMYFTMVKKSEHFLSDKFFEVQLPAEYLLRSLSNHFPIKSC